MCNECARDNSRLLPSAPRAHRGLQDDGVPVLHVQPVPARLRQLRVVVQELEQDDDQAVTPRPEPQHAAMSDQNRALGQEAD